LDLLQKLHHNYELRVANHVWTLIIHVYIDNMHLSIWLYIAFILIHLGHWVMLQPKYTFNLKYIV
jgi:hypothetical protein